MDSNMSFHPAIILILRCPHVDQPYHAIDISQFASGHISGVLSKLNPGIEAISRRRSDPRRARTISRLMASLDRPFQSVKNALHQLETNFGRLCKKIGNRHATPEDALARLDRYHAAAKLSQKASPLVTQAKRLEAQMAELDLRPPNLPLQRTDPISESERLLDSALETASLERVGPAAGEDPTPQTLPSIRAITATQPHVQTIVSARKMVEEQMSRTLSARLARPGHALLLLPDRPQPLHPRALRWLDDLRTRRAHRQEDQARLRPHFLSQTSRRKWSPSSLPCCPILILFAHEPSLFPLTDPHPTSSLGYRSRARTEPTVATLPQWTSVLWARLTGLNRQPEHVLCREVYTLQKVLEWTKDPVPGVPFLEAVPSSASMLEERPSTVFWTTLSGATNVYELGSNPIAQALTANYPRLLRPFQESFSRISLHIHTTYNLTSRSLETILALRAVLPLETIMMPRMTEADNGRAEELNELEPARFSTPSLVRSAPRKAKEVVHNYLKRAESRVVFHQKEHPVESEETFTENVP
ncbi:hypothetical protein PtA15_13A322 [Puccinia triticina]|uniref:Conserved oligomeric Golgi complex subunit 5 helical domain-containing protein n=1 Tax=Puccinia triticina TaxID=208348 RepID=A0ABY7D2K7_9BASI|nr:uncharacterized protein PtA15_13A322 [Puccinia triticina]WAQ90922.1 hypothetical protein PtA15_13A322 [Puccinia triticina]